MYKEQTGSWNLTPSDWAKIRRMASMASRKAYGLKSIHVAWSVNKIQEESQETQPNALPKLGIKMYGNREDPFELYKRKK